MSKTWVTSDWHLGEDRFKLMMRPFTQAQQMVDEFLRLHNAVVAPDDKVLMVGDAVYQKTPEFLPQIARFNGVKTLFRGNHDKVFSNEDFAPYFEKIYEEGVGLELDIHDIPCYLVHYPTCGIESRLNLVGHVHSAWKFQLNAINVGVDTNHFAPYDIEQIPSLFNAICNHYDEDIWAAYNQSNEAFREIRGKKSRYFTQPSSGTFQAS